MLVRFLFLPLGLAALPWAGRAPECQPIALFASLVVACGVAIAPTVGTCWFAVARYQLDFWPPIALAAALGLGLLAGAATRLWQRAALASVAALGVLVGLLLGMSGNGDVFRARSPKLFEQLAGSLSPSSLVEFPRRMGCYRRPFSDLGGHDHAVGGPADPAPSAETCSQRCRELGARYATVREPGQCGCSNVLAHRGLSRVKPAEGEPADAAWTIASGRAPTTRRRPAARPDSPTCSCCAPRSAGSGLAPSAW